MINISFNIRSPIDKRDNRVIVRVRWNHKQYEEALLLVCMRNCMIR